MGTPATVTLTVKEGPQRGKTFSFDTHDVFIFGRAEDCHCSIPDDGYISGHHFILEANPPECELRDLGSKNGTFVNDALAGRREKGQRADESPQQGKPVRVKDGDVIRAGTTVFAVTVTAPVPEAAPVVPLAEPLVEAPEEKSTEAPAIVPGSLQMETALERLTGESAPTPAPTASPKSQSPKKEPGLVTKMMSGQGAPLAEGDEALPEIPGYTLYRLLSEGGQGRIYSARKSDGTGGFAVVKVIRPEIRNPTEEQLKMFRREMSVAKDLVHPNIVRVLDEGEAAGGFFFVMEFCDQGSVGEMMMRGSGKIRPIRAIKIVLDALAGLEYAHGQNVVHRDIKPDNILLAGAGDGVPKIADFGLAKNFAMAGMSGMTATGYGGSGTPEFMPKEQLTNYRSVKPVSDVFAMGATLYNMLTGKFVYDFSGRDPCVAILDDKRIPIATRGIQLPEALVVVIEKSTAPDFKQRYPTAREFREALAAAFEKGQRELIDA